MKCANKKYCMNEATHQEEGEKEIYCKLCFFMKRGDKYVVRNMFLDELIKQLERIKNENK